MRPRLVPGWARSERRMWADIPNVVSMNASSTDHRIDQSMVDNSIRREGSTRRSCPAPLTGGVGTRLRSSGGSVTIRRPPGEVSPSADTELFV